ncbi:E3 SUMO-protein ligase ZBED1-like isoform X1 [Phyllopteryx taeniolatus]|uniref:E3 SUMO-protein ligase ZBED1-like isoform X1 n=1 Tax=Phyllopteryx taeniolatus TaxID=161469 RepID=UPI002AD5720C|nr:E3 SUMO-protein ligase ZBED1-like isoform X1 [Phyllopteryx taeniolatus]
MVPVYTISKVGFKKMIRSLDKRYVIPPRNFFSQVAIPELYEKCKAEVQTELSDVQYYAVTTDSSSRTAEPYISLTVHFIHQEFEIKSRCLQTSYFPEDYPSENIAFEMREALAAWGLHDNRLVCIITDNAANTAKAAAQNEWTRLQCFAHRLHLAVENAVKHDGRIERAVGVCKKLVGHFSRSWKARRALEKAQKDLNLPTHSLLSECQTRWGSRQMMISRILEQQQAITQVLSMDKKMHHLTPTWQDIDVLESVSRSLGPLLELTDALSGEDYFSVSYVKPVLHLLNNSILVVQEDDADLTKKVKSEMLNYINKLYNCKATQELLDIACCLDPRFKMDFISADNKSQVSARVISEMTVTLETQETALCSSEVEPKAAATPQKKKAKRSLGCFFKEKGSRAAEKCDSFVNLKDTVEAEFDNYLLAPSIDTEEDPLTWWKIHQVNFPHLAKLARKYLCIPATSSPSEKLFSTSGHIVTCQRSSLKPAMVDRLVFLAKNLNT